MWLQHMFSFIGTIVRYFIGAIGTTVVGWLVDLAFASSLAIAVLFKKNKEHGWRAMLDHWRREYKEGIRFALLCALIIYMPVIIWSIGKAIYEDHEYFVGTAKNLRASIRQNAAASHGIQRDLEGQISDWKATCAGFESANGVLTNQNRDQQNTINNCQSDAIKLLTPPPLKIKARVYAIDTKTATFHAQRVNYFEVVAITNKSVTPVDITVSCDQDFRLMGDGPSLGRGIMVRAGEGFSRPDSKSVRYKIQSPAWTPDDPVGITVGTQTPDLNCQIVRN